MPSPNIAVNGVAIRIIRQRTGLSVSGLAKEVGTYPAYISDLEGGRRTNVSPPLFQKLVKALVLDDVRAIMADPWGEYDWVIPIPSTDRYVSVSA